MKKVVTIVCLSVLGLVLLAYSCTTTYALAGADMEIIFLVTDAETREVIPGATIDLRLYTADDPPNGKFLKPVTDDQGKAVYFREKATCTHTIRPFRRTRTSFNLSESRYAVSANGYAPREDDCLPASKYENLGRIGEKGPYRLQFRVSLLKAQP